MRLFLTLLLATALLSACSNDDTADSDKETINTETLLSEAQRFDPPKTFDVSSATPIPVEVVAGYNTFKTSRYALKDISLYTIDRNTIQKTNTLTGENLWNFEFPLGIWSDTNGTLIPKEGPSSPVVNETGDVVYISSLGKIPAKGTTAEKYVLENIAISTETGERIWKTDIALSNFSSRDANGWSTILSIQDDTFVATYQSSTGYTKTFALSLEEGKTSWESDDLGIHVVDGKVISFPQGQKYAIQALSNQTGRQVWESTQESGSELTIFPTSDSLLVKVSSSSFLSIDSKILHLNTTSGEILHQLEDPGYNTCVDPTSSTYWICVGENSENQRTLSAIDPSDYSIIWNLPDETRIAPRVHAFHKDALYGIVTNDDTTTGVVLDLSTGEDLAENQGIRVLEANKFGAIAQYEGDTLFIPASS